MKEFIWYCVEGYTTADCFFSNRFENLEDAWSFYGKDEDWKEVEFIRERFFRGRCEVEIIKSIK